MNADTLAGIGIRRTHMGDKSPKSKMKQQTGKDADKAKASADLQKQAAAKAAAGGKNTKK